MKIYILSDMEGISGIGNEGMTDRAHPDYAEGRRLLMDDNNVVIDALFENGVGDVVVCDTHAGGGHMRVREMDPRASYETPNRGLLMPSLDAGFAGVILLGHHAMAGTLNGFLDHTMNSKMVFEYRLNGRPLGEIGIEAAWAGHFDVPVIMVSGDRAACDEAVDLFGAMAVAPVKEGIGRNRARCLPVPRAHELLRRRTAEALQRIADRNPFKPDLPAEIRLTLYRSDMADGFARAPGVERVDGRTVSRKIAALREVWSWF